MESVKYISEEDFHEINRRSKVSKGDILFAMIGTVGNPVIIGDDTDALMLDLRTDFSLPCKLIAEEHFLYDSIFTRI